VDEAVLVEERAHRARDRVAQTQITQHPFAAEIEVAILESQLLACMLVVMERRRLRLVENGELVRDELDLAGRKRRVHGAVGPRPDKALDGDDVLAPEPLRFRKDLR